MQKGLTFLAEDFNPTVQELQEQLQTLNDWFGMLYFIIMCAPTWVLIFFLCSAVNNQSRAPLAFPSQENHSSPLNSYK